MAESTFDLRAQDGKSVEITKSTTFYAIQIDYDGNYFTLPLDDAEKLAKWLLDVHPYGNKHLKVGE